MPIQTSGIVDYANPLIKVEQLVRRIHDYCLQKDYRTAGDKAVELLAEVRMLTATLTIMEINNDSK